MIHRQEFMTARDGLQLFWQAWEPDVQARAMVCLVHGLGEHAGRYTHVADAFTKAGIAMHAIDLRGHGQSKGLRGHTPSLEQWHEDIELFLERAGEQCPRFLYGHSLGGSLIISFCLQRQPSVSGVIASGPAFKRAFEVPAIRLFLGRLMGNVWPTFSQHSNLQPADISREPAVVQAYAEDPQVHDMVTARLFVVATAMGEDALAGAASFSTPLLLLQAGQDRIVDAEASKTFFAEAVSVDKTLRFYEGMFHEVHNEPQKAQVIDEMVAWVLARCG